MLSVSTSLSALFANQEDLLDGEDIAKCPSCSLIIRVIYCEDDIDRYCEAPQKQKVKLATN
jgi:hypothetical protein